MTQRKFLIGVISDTHGLLRRQAIGALRGADLIIHAGDIGRPELLDRLRELAPVFAVRGNVDIDPWAAQLPAAGAVHAGGLSFWVLHDITELDLDPRAAGVAAVIYGHSHRPSITQPRGILHLNPGSAGPRRFRLPVTLARIVVAGAVAQPEIVTLDV